MNNFTRFQGQVIPSRKLKSTNFQHQYRCKNYVRLVLLENHLFYKGKNCQKCNFFTTILRQEAYEAKQLYFLVVSHNRSFVP